MLLISVRDESMSEVEEAFGQYPHEGVSESTYLSIFNSTHSLIFLPALTTAT